MLEIDEHNRSLEHSSPSPEKVTDSQGLTRWVHQIIGIKHARTQCKLRGHNLYVLCESKHCPDATIVLERLVQAFTSTALNRYLPANSPSIDRIIIYGRELDQAKPSWTKSFYLNHSDSHATVEEHDRTSNTDPVSPTITPPPPAPSPTEILERAKQGHAQSIARYLNLVFNNLGISIKAKVESERKKTAVTGQESVASAETTTHELENQLSLKRLFVSCESAYAPDPSLLADPIAQRLRQLELQGFRDAIVFGQVSGEAKPEWLLRIDLTPPEQTLREWARWGDVQAIVQLLNRALTAQSIQVSALLKDSTLHLSCTGATAAAPDKLTVLTGVAPLLDGLTPQGIQGATVYGLTGRGEIPAWVHWLDLPASANASLSPTTLELAQQGNIEAIAFLLTRLLNPDLNSKLATGGIRVQLRQRGDLLHIMTEAPNCPLQSQVGSPIVRFLKPLPIATISGVRIYGRRAGQKQPLWSYGVDFATRLRLVPEATPEFAASDTYVGDLLSPPGALVLRSDLTEEKPPSLFSQVLDEVVYQIQQFLVRSQCFIPIQSAALSSGMTVDAPQRMEPAGDQSAKTALIWGTVGLLLIVQTDWILGQVLQSRQPKPFKPTPTQSVAPPMVTAKPIPQQQLPSVSLRKSQLQDRSAFNSSGFTQAGTKELAPVTPPETAPGTLVTPTYLPASPLQRQAESWLGQDRASYPTFNSRQFDTQIALYRRYLEQYGTPDILVVGSSRALRGIDPVALKTALAEQGYANVRIFNFGINGATARVVDLLVRQLLPQEKLPKLILFADGARAFNSGRRDITYNGIVASEGYKTLLAGTPPLPGTNTIVAKSTNLNAATKAIFANPGDSYRWLNQMLTRSLGNLSLAYEQRDQLKTLLRDTVTALLPENSPTTGLGNSSFGSEGAVASQLVLSDDQIKVDVDGFLPLSIQFNPATYYQKYARVLGDYDSDYESFSPEGQQTEALASLTQFAQSHQIPLVFINLPLTKEYLDPARKRHEETFQQHMLTLAPQLGFVYRDLSQELLTQPAYFSDPSHLNRYGAYEMSQRLAQDALIPWPQGN